MVPPGNPLWLVYLEVGDVQSTIPMLTDMYAADVIESVSFKGPSATIKCASGYALVDVSFISLVN